MPRIINLNREIFIAFGLGFATLVANLFAHSVATSSIFIPIGNIFLFLSAGALGLGGVLISFAVGVVFETFISGKHIEFFRLLITCCALGYCARKYPRLPAFAVVLALWLGIFAPGLFYLKSVSNFSLQVETTQVFINGISEVLFAMISGVLLLNSRIWTFLSTMPRHVPISSLVIHVVTSISTLAMFGALSAAMGTTSLASADVDATSMGGLISILLLGITVPALLSWRLSIVMSNNFQELFASGLLTGVNNKSFSGLSSEFWRRRSKTNLAIERQITDETTTGTHEPTPEELKARIVSPNQGLCALNRNGTITFVNRKFRRYCEITSNEVLGKNIATLAMNPVICKRIVKMLDCPLTKGPRSTEVKINQLPEKLRFYEITCHRADAFEDSSIINGPDSIIITMKDITDKRTVETHLLQGQKLESLGILVEGIAHTFNNALTAITGQASFAKRCQERPQVDKSLNEILKTAFGAGTVVRQLLDFASGRPSLMKPANVIKVIEERLDLLKRIAGDGCEIIIEKKVDSLGIVCDTNLIMQALTNLILNSKESYANMSGKIVISIDTEHMDEDVSEMHPGTRPGDFARVRIKDFGHGMSVDVLGKAFDPLFTTKTNTGHTGLGLSIVFAIVRAHDGFLTAESSLEKGTSISVYFPICELAEETPVVTSGESKSSADLLNNPELQGNHEQILVVEDETNVRELVTTMLTTLGYEVTSCSDGEEALAKSSEREFDLILVDMVIPKIKGLDLIERVRQSRANVKALVMTGYGNSLQISDSTTQIIHKPFDIDTLARAVKTSLTKS